MTKRAALLFVLVTLITPSLWAQNNPRGEAKVTLAGKAIAIDYGRPSLRGRDMLAQAEIGQPWRMGADSATTLKTEADLVFGSTVLPKGEYILTATKVAEDGWQLNISDRKKDKVAEVPLASSKVNESVELFTIQLTGDKDKGEFSMAWGSAVLKAPFTAK